MSGIETKCIHSGYEPVTGEPRQIPIVQSTTFKYETSEEMAKCFDLQSNGYFYSRLQNPTNDMVAAKIADLEGGIAGILTSSGQAANFMAVFNIANAGDHVLASSQIYGGTYNLFSTTMKKMGIDFTFISPNASEKEIQSEIKENTKAIFGETIANPSLSVFDIEKFAKVAHKNNIPLIVDNTFATPIHCRPIEFGADIVTHSTTKYMDGHGSTVGGVIVDSGKFNWESSNKFRCLTEPDYSYHGIIYTKEFKEKAYAVKCVVQLMRDFGMCQSPQSAYVINLGLESLHVRMERHVANAQKIADFLSKDSRIKSVKYPGLKTDTEYKLAKKYFKDGKSCGVISFEIAGDRAKAEDFMKKLKVISIETHVADVKSCILHPASSTHRQLSDSELIDAGISPVLIRLSCGIENVDDLINDIDQALS